MLGSRPATEVSRQSLYEQVWSKPMTKLARDYGISDVALAKICRKLDVPYPWRGYWRRIETGKAAKQLPLPQNNDPRQQKAFIYRTIRPETSVSEHTAKQILMEEGPESKIEVPSRMERLHHLLSGNLTEWRSSAVDEYGAIRSGSLRQLNIRVSPKHLSRAVRIMNALFLALEARGYRVGIQDGFTKALGVRIDGEPVEFGIEEKFQRTERPQDKRRHNDPWSYCRYEYVPTGVLQLKINEYADGLQKSWRDGKSSRLENSLNDFIIGLLKVAEELKARRLKREEEERLRLEAQRQREEEERRRQEELARRNALIKEAESWAKAQQLRMYLAAVKEAVIGKHGTIEQGSKAEQWFIWAHTQADLLDPLRSQ